MPLNIMYETATIISSTEASNTIKTASAIFNAVRRAPDRRRYIVNSVYLFFGLIRAAELAPDYIN